MTTAILRREEDGIEFFTVQATGESGMSQSGLSILAGVSQQAVSKLEKSLTTKSPSHQLEPWVGKALTLTTDSEYKNATIYHSGFCSAVIQHYAFKGNKVAQYSLTKFSTSGIDSWIQQQTGWNQTTQEYVTRSEFEAKLATLKPLPALPKASVDPVPGEIKPLTERQCITRLIRGYVYRYNTTQLGDRTDEQKVTRWMYRELKYRHNFDVYARFKNSKCKRKIDLIEAEGYLPQLHAICNHFLGNHAHQTLL